MAVNVFRAMSPGTRWAYIGNLQGIGASIALNAAEAASKDHGPGPVVVAGSVPVFLYVALEILARKKITGWKRFITYPGFIVVVAVTFVTSYQDQASRLDAWGFADLSAAILPIGIDGLMVVAAVALLEGDAKPGIVAVEDLPERQIGDRLADARGEYATWDGTQWVPDQPVRVAAERPPRARPASGRPRRGDPLRERWEAALGTENPFTPEDLAAIDGKGINSARSKIQRWKKDHDGRRSSEGGVPAGAPGGDVPVDDRGMVEEDAGQAVLQDVAP